jgi:hypothetical protein
MPGPSGRLGVSVLMRFLRPFVGARSDILVIGGFEMCRRSWGVGRANGLPAMRGPHGPQASKNSGPFRCRPWSAGCTIGRGHKLHYSTAFT